MNIFNKVTMESLKKNRARTVVTIIGVILSASMITAVTTFTVSLQSFLVELEIANNGNWHVKFTDVDADFAQRVIGDNETETVAMIQNIGYAVLDGSVNERKPYLFVAGFDDAAFDVMPVNLISGRLPRNSGEIVVSELITLDSGIKYEIGETLTLALGKRVTYYNSYLGQRNPYKTGESEYTNETLSTERVNTYTVVGVASPGFDGYFTPGYTLMTKFDPQDAGGSGKYDMLIALKAPGKVYAFTDKFIEKVTMVGDEPDLDYTRVTFNSGLLRFLGVSDNDNFTAVLYSLGAILISLILAGSILLIYNSFSISVSERSRQFGILSSVGATKKQLRKSVLFEGFCIGIIGIPLGILAGVAGIGVTLRVVGGLFISMVDNSHPGSGLTLTLSLAALALAAAVGAVTILISAYIPARRAVRKSAIDAIRQARDVKIKAKAVKTSRITNALFGLEGTLALKNFKRSKKRYRSTVVSLFVSMVLFISASAFGLYLQRGAGMTFEDVEYDIAFGPRSPSAARAEAGQILPLYDQMKTAGGVYRSVYGDSLNGFAPTERGDYTERYLKYLADTDKALGGMSSRNDSACYLTISFVDDANYQSYLNSLGFSPNDYGISQGKLLAVAKYVGYDHDLRRTVNVDVFKEREITLDVTVMDSTFGQQEEAPSHKIALTVIETMPEGFSASQFNGVCAVAPYSDIAAFDVPKEAFNGLEMAFSSHDPAKSVAEMEEIIKDSGTVFGYSLVNVAQILEQNRNIILIISIFTYGFVILISLITVANVFNTISTGIQLRGREFAMLRSVGLGDRGFNKMMNFECIFYGLKALLYGLPASIAVTWLIHRGMTNGVDIPFILPWGSIAVSVFSVFSVVFVTMLYAVSKIKKANVIDALRSDMV